MAGRKPVGAKRTSKAEKQLNDWVESEIILRLIISSKAFSVFHTGYLQKLDDSFYLGPNEGGGTFFFNTSDCQPVIGRQGDFTTVSFCKGEIALRLLEGPWPGGEPKSEPGE
jgi:hypothetical protein